MPRGDLGTLKYVLVGSWKSQPALSPSLPVLEYWAKVAWRLKGHVLISYLNHNLLYLEFDSSEEAKWVLVNGTRIFKGDVLHLEWWNPFVECVGRKDQAKEAWLRVLGLPLHMWTKEMLKK